MGSGEALALTPISLREANAFVERNHRHHKGVTGHKFSIGCTRDGELVGVAIMGRPVSRYLDDGLTLEVNRLCTTGAENACSMLYGAAARAARAMGYQKIITYTLDTEPGTSLRAAGWQCAGPAGGERWTGKRRPAADLYPPQKKLRYEKQL
ncbi:XF1762 family protein [Oscillospiraceae bacterium 50-16]